MNAKKLFKRFKTALGFCGISLSQDIAQANQLGQQTFGQSSNSTGSGMPNSYTNSSTPSRNQQGVRSPGSSPQSSKAPQELTVDQLKRLKAEVDQLNKNCTELSAELDNILAGIHNPQDYISTAANKSGGHGDDQVIPSMADNQKTGLQN